MIISGTFIDEITHDIPSNNWGESDWRKEFSLMRAIGIDTVIVIRPGYRNKAVFPSETLKKKADLLPVYSDLLDLFLELAEINDISFFCGTYDSGIHLPSGDAFKEIDINLAFVDELWEKYGHRKAFKGWYLSHEIAKKDGNGVKCLEAIGKHCKNISNGLTTFISPFIWGCKQFKTPVTVKQHEKDWSDILATLRDVIDIVAFQDGNVPIEELPEYMAINAELIRKNKMTVWSNLESFDRDMPFNFPPIEWRKLWWKLMAAEKADVEKIITFEFSHFMSPYSCWPAARKIFERYCEHFCLNVQMPFADEENLYNRSTTKNPNSS